MGVVRMLRACMQKFSLIADSQLPLPQDMRVDLPSPVTLGALLLSSSAIAPRSAERSVSAVIKYTAEGGGGSRQLEDGRLLEGTSQLAPRCSRAQGMIRS